MHPNFAGIDRKPQATTGKHWQAELPILRAAEIADLKRQLAAYGEKAA